MADGEPRNLSWDTPDQSQFYAHITKLVARAGDNEGRLPIEETLEPRLRALAAFSLVQDGMLILSSDSPTFLILTDAGKRRFTGIRSLGHG